MMHERHGWVHLLLLAVTLAWGLNNIVMKLGFAYLTPQQFGGIRMLMVLPFMIYLAGFLPGRRKFSRGDFVRIMLIGAAGMGMFQVFFPLGVHYTSAPVGGILMATMPVQVVVLSLLFRLERPGWKSIFGVILTIIGLTIITLTSQESQNSGETTLWGIVFLVTAELGFAVYTTFLRPYMKRYSSLQVAGLAMAVSVGVYFLAFAPQMMQIDLKSIPGTAWAATAYSGMFALFLANVLWNISIKYIGSTKVAVYGNMPTVFVLIFSAVIFGDLLFPLQLVGAVTILAGVILVQLRNNKMQKG